MATWEEHLNAVHGGTHCTLADLAFAVATNFQSNMAVAINANISFLKAAGQETRTLSPRQRRFS
ncbi:MAG: hypothetical protein U5J82_15520 [Desulfobacterales bacterium]|nr:hypothetical protein [Desulfobacterales bacterium]